MLPAEDIEGPYSWIGRLKAAIEARLASRRSRRPRQRVGEVLAAALADAASYRDAYASEATAPPVTHAVIAARQYLSLTAFPLSAGQVSPTLSMSWLTSQGSSPYSAGVSSGPSSRALMALSVWRSLCSLYTSDRARRVSASMRQQR